MSGYIFGSLWTIDFGLACGRSLYNENRLTKTIERGTKLADISGDDLIPRSIILNQLKEILQPTKYHSSYHMVCGEFGTGKTLLIKMASKEVRHGIIYVDVPSNIKNFGIAFGEALNFAFEEDITFTRQVIRKIGGTNDESNIPKWNRALSAFKRIAKVYKANHNKPPVIIYDNVSRLARMDPDILYVLQDDAKDSADDGNYIAVFVSTRSAWSRAIAPPMEISDISEEESMKYLVEKRKINEETAKELYQLVGGRILELKTIANGILAGRSIEDIKKQKLIEIEQKFFSAKLLKGQKYHEIGKRAINALLDSKEININIFIEFFENNDEECEEYQEVLGANVFAYHPSSNTVSFQSRSVEFYIQENSSIFINLLDLGPTDDSNSNRA
ncbi:P-loop containing nucleoside triphosphate hydrolase protein [Glomus cerebriforme]|uniref:P-loop containing nucleoside triphosphate hydrolase protein n=1 Tax=Glomus cerebriforme TaxID=658196 RepID=A0A397TIR4_9GLOM|nr:P-loop containing nucleoside triphosphate hydrolase protein [Glomus cerebriforme]